VWFAGDQAKNTLEHWTYTGLQSFCLVSMPKPKVKLEAIKWRRPLLRVFPRFLRFHQELWQNGAAITVERSSKKPDFEWVQFYCEKSAGKIGWDHWLTQRRQKLDPPWQKSVTEPQPKSTVKKFFSDMISPESGWKFGKFQWGLATIFSVGIFTTFFLTLGRRKNGENRARALP